MNKRICNTEGCDNIAKNRRHCNCCRQKKWRKNNPFKYHWQNLRNKARQRGKQFSLTLNQFKQLWLQHPEKWKLKCSEQRCPWEVDRIRNWEGYHIDNVQIISKKANMRKYWEEDREYAKMYNKPAPF